MSVPNDTPKLDGKDNRIKRIQKAYYIEALVSFWDLYMHYLAV